MTGPLSIPSLTGPVWSGEELLVCHSHSVFEQNQLSHSGEPHHEVCQALEQAAQGSGGVTIPGGIKKTHRRGASGHGLVGIVDGWIR